MARSVLASEMATRVRYITDTENDSHISATELYKQLTAAVADTWDKILGHGLGGEFVKTVYFNTVAEQVEYAIATMTNGTTTAGTGSTGISDFYKVKTLYVSDGSGLYRPIHRTNPNEEYALKGPSTAASMKLCYVPCAPVFTTGNESFDGINGWEEHVINLAAIRVKSKKEDDTGPYRSIVRELEDRMATHANRNDDEPPRIIRRRRAQAWANRIAPYAGGVYAWDLRGANLELYAPSMGLWV